MGTAATRARDLELKAVQVCGFSVQINESKYLVGTSISDASSHIIYGDANGRILRL